MANSGAHKRTLTSKGLGILCLCGTLALTAAAQRADVMSKIAREYVRLVLAMGQHDADYVDAYYGPDDIKQEAERAKLTLDAIGAEREGARGAGGGARRRARTSSRGCGISISKSSSPR